MIRALAALILALGFALAGTAFAGVTGIAILDRAISEGHPAGLTPTWYNYPGVSRAQADTYSKFFLEQLRLRGKNILASVPSDIAWYCPNFLMLTRAQREIFWLRFMSSFPELESTFNPASETPETDPRLQGVISTGFFQISLKSIQQGGYGCTMIQSQEDLRDWRKNTACSIKILDSYVQKYNMITWNTEGGDERDWQGFSRYWGIFRGVDLKSPAGRTKILNYLTRHRPEWARDGLSSKPAYLRDGEFSMVVRDAKGKPVVGRNGKPKRRAMMFYRMLYRMNQMPFCN